MEPGTGDDMSGHMIHEDTRPIAYAERLFPDPDNETFTWTTRENRWKNCDEIRAYLEAGMGAMETWLAIYKDGEIIARTPARFHEIGYVPTQEAEW